MNSVVYGSPSFAYLDVTLEPGEQILAEADAMASMDAALELRPQTNGGFFPALAKKFLGGESFFVNVFHNPTPQPRRLTLVQGTPGDIRQLQLQGESLCLQPGAYVASTPGLRLGVAWAGLASGIAREGFFKLIVSGTGTLWYGAYGCMLDKDVAGEYIVDTSHLVAYEPQMKLKLQLAGGLFTSLFSGEGLVTRIEGQGKIVIQTRSLSGLANWLNPKL